MNNAPVLTATGLPYHRRRAVNLLAIFAGMALMVTYVETMVLPAFETFFKFFDLSSTSDYGTVAWILSAYLLVGTVVVPIFGKLGDLYGKKRMLMIAMSIYATAVTIAGFSPNLGAALGVSRPDQIYLLIGARAVQGIGMGMFPLAFSMIPEVFPKAGVGQAQGIISAMFAAGAALGLVGGGWISENWGWQLTYHTVVPVAVLLVVLAYVLLHETAKHPAPNLDVVGIVALGGGLSSLLLGVTEGPYWGWTGWSSVHWGALAWGTPEFFVIAVVLLVGFLLWEQVAKSPVIRFASMKARNIWVANVNGILVGSLMFFAFTVAVILAELPSYLDGLGASEFTFGLMALPSVLSMLIGGAIFGKATSVLGPKPISLLGFALMGLGGGALYFLHSTQLELSLLMIPLMAGNVALLISMSNMIVLTVDRSELGVQTGMNQTFRNLGSAIAPVVTTTILASYIAVYPVNVSTPFGTEQVLVRSYALAGFEVVFALMAVLALFGFVLSFALKNYRFLADGTQTGHIENAGSRAESVGTPPRASGASHPVVDPAPD